MRLDSEVEAPLVFSGIVIDQINNPLLIVPARFVYSTSSTPWWWDRFAELVIEATGFSPKPLLVGDMPLVSQYALVP
ncbi:hypothetical protein [Metallosphaera hakonensis]|uniref:hypothetical protein n=1 Tax=Metallosphaera hakonensis TaxID=79601 RepID=UPI0006D0DD73|nr:hypothetical protein [Metallosphaera hakonensis]